MERPGRDTTRPAKNAGLSDSDVGELSIGLRDQEFPDMGAASRSASPARTASSTYTLSFFLPCLCRPRTGLLLLQVLRLVRMCWLSRAALYTR